MWGKRAAQRAEGVAFSTGRRAADQDSPTSLRAAAVLRRCRRRGAPPETAHASRSDVDAFVSQVVSGDHAGAIRDWYHEDAWMQENQAPPRQGGREALVAQEQAVLDRCERVVTERLGGPVIEGDTVAIRWRFTFTFKDGRTMRQEEVAWQTWRGGRIADETFFYDPAQRNT